MNMQNNDHAPPGTEVETESAAQPAVDAGDADVELQRIRKLRVMAAVSAPLLMSLLMSKRANAWSPPPDPDEAP